MKTLTYEQWQALRLEDSYEYARFLHALLCHLRPKKSFEIGIGPATSTLLYLYTLPYSTLITIDPQELPAERSRIDSAGGSRVRHIIMSSNDIHARPELFGDKFDYIYIDGNHEYWHVLGDAETCHNMIKPGGHLVFDDGHMPDVFKAVDDFFNKHTTEYEELSLDVLGVSNDHRARVLRRK